MADAEKGQEIDLDDAEALGEDEIDERITCSVSYVMICIMLPLMNGLLNSFAWSGFSLYVRKNGWSLSLAGLALSIGCLGRLIVQQVIFRAGIWTCVIFATLQGTIAAIAIAYPDQAIVVFLQAGTIPAFDVTVAIEGLTFDTWSASQEQVGQAQSTVLSIFTIAYALAATFGGVIYDAGSWTGISVFHATCCFAQLLVFVVQPAMLKSFREFIHRIRGGDGDDKDENEEEVKELGDQVTSIVPGPKVSVVAPEVSAEPAPPRGSDPGAGGEAVPALPGALEEPEDVPPDGIQNERSDGHAASSIARKASAERGRQSGLVSPNLARSSIMTGSSRGSYNSSASGDRRPQRLTVASRGTRATGVSRRSRRQSRNTVGTNRSTGTMATVLTNMSRFTSMTEMGENFQYNYGIQSGLRPHIASHAVEMAVQSDDEKEEEDATAPAKPEVASGPKKRTTEKNKGLSRDLYVVAALIAMCSFTCNMSYAVEWSTFAIFFAEQHNWRSATWAGICQTAGDLAAAVLMGLLKNMPHPNLDELHGVRKLWHGTFSHPYLLVVFVLGWAICNAGLAVPLLALGIASQVLMGTVYVFTMKGITDLNLFYSLGDSKAFLQLQVQCKNADAIGCLLAGGLSFPLYEFNPIAPFVLCSGVSLLTFIVVTIGFCCRVGFGQEIETAEAQRARRLGLRRVSTWKSVKSTIEDDDE